MTCRVRPEPDRHREPNTVNQMWFNTFQLLGLTWAFLPARISASHCFTLHFRRCVQGPRTAAVSFFFFLSVFTGLPFGLGSKSTAFYIIIQTVGRFFIIILMKLSLIHTICNVRVFNEATADFLWGICCLCVVIWRTPGVAEETMMSSACSLWIRFHVGLGPPVKVLSSMGERNGKPLKEIWYGNPLICLQKCSYMFCLVLVDI